MQRSGRDYNRSQTIKSPQAQAQSAPNRYRGRLIAEAAAIGLAFGSILWWASVCLVSTFRPQDLPDPYWEGIPWLRTDTSGFAAFIIAAISLTIGEALRLWRRYSTPDEPVNEFSCASTFGVRISSVALIFLAVSETIAILTTGLVVYLSLNSVTHPESLVIHVSHLLPWPAEGTLRIVALLLSAFSVTVTRYLHILVSRSRARSQQGL